MSRAARVAIAALLCCIAALPGCRRAVSADAQLLEARRQLRLGNLSEALTLAEKGCAGLSAQTDSVPYWRFRLLKIEVMLAQGQTAEAWALLQQPPPDRPEFHDIAVWWLTNRAYAKFRFAEYAEAERMFAEALAMLPAGDLSVLAAEIEVRRGGTLTRLADLNGADRAFHRALRIATRLNDDYLRAAALGNLGFLSMHKSRYDEAIPLFEQAGALSEKIGARKFMATTVGNIGRCYYELGDLDRAVSLQSRAERLASEVGDDVGREIWLSSLGDAYVQRGEFRKAIPYLEKALALSRQLREAYTSMQTLNGLASASLAANDTKSARRYNEQALKMDRDTGIKDLRGRTWIRAGQIAEAEKDTHGAEKAYREALAAGAAISSDIDLWEAHAGLAHVAAARSNWRTAESEFREALDGLERTRTRLARDEWKLSFHSAALVFYRDYVAFLMGRGQAERALDVAESSRARLLAQRLGMLDAMRPAPAGHFRDLSRKLNAALVSVWLTPERSVMWVVTPRKLHSFPLPGETEIRGLVDAYLGAVQGQRDPIETDNPAAHRLSELLIAPILRVAPDVRRVILVPDGPLHQLNPESLPVGSEKPHYWVEDVAVAVAPSLALVSQVAGGTGRQDATLLLIGNPTPPPGEFPALAEVQREVDGVRRAFPPDQTAVFTGASANPQVYREANPGRFSFIHFAAHATANRESPLDSAVVLSPKDDSYKLYARDIIGVPLRADLVTISACRSAGSRVYSGEGLVGFAWAFLQAGAKNVIAGLWDVNDRSTSLLMQQLYKEMSSGRSPASALRAAKLGVIAAGGPYRKPYYWAPFQVFARTPVF